MVPYLLRKNHKGHYVFDIRHFLTAGNSNTQGHVRVRVTPPRQSAPNESQVLEFHPVHFQLDSHDHDADTFTHGATWNLMQRLRRASAQMVATSKSSAPIASHPQAHTGDHVAASDVTRDRGDREVHNQPDQGQHQGQVHAATLRLQSGGEHGSKRSPHNAASGHVTDFM